MKIGFIGAGAMGEAMISALLKQKGISKDMILACDIDQARLTYIGKKYKVGCTSDIDRAVSDRDILAIKPQILASVMKDLKGRLTEGQLVLSIIAGTKLGTIVKGLDHKKAVRVMPNTPAQVGEGMSVWTATNAVTQKQKNAVRTILSAMGREVYFSDEKYIDMATAISGSGPAYIFLIMEALIDAAVHIGLPRDTAVELVMQTVLGSARLARESDKHLAELKNMVTSPGGTTAEGLLCLEEGGLRATITEAVIAAYEKARLLGGGVSK
jgi:pyrroline-5-carboxylate reductase